MTIFIFFINLIKFFFVEYLFVTMSKIEKRAVVRPNVSIFIRMIRRPLIKIKFNLKYFTLKYVRDVNILIHHEGKVLKKQEGRSKCILESNDVIQHIFYCTDLVISHSCINCISIHKLIWIILFAYFVFVENWEFGCEVLVILFLKDMLDGVAVER